MAVESRINRPRRPARRNIRNGGIDGALRSHNLQRTVATADDPAIGPRAACQPDCHRSVGGHGGDLGLLDRDGARVVRGHRDGTAVDFFNLADDAGTGAGLDRVGLDLKGTGGDKHHKQTADCGRN